MVPLSFKTSQIFAVEYMKKAILAFTVFFMGLALSAYAAVEDTTLDSLVDAIIVGVLDPLIKLLFVLATALFLWGVVQYVVGSEGPGMKLDKGKKVMTWGIIGMFVMASAWGIVKVLCDFFGSTACTGFF